MQSKQVQLLLQQLETLYPAAFKRNYLLYSQIKTRGILDDQREVIPWVLAVMIFIPISLILKDFYLTHLENLDPLQSHSYAIISILLVLMWVLPLVIKQIKHSSNSLYQLQRHAPFKLAAVILLSGLNLVFLESSLLMWILFYFGVNFGFVRFYKENLFRDHSQSVEHHQLQQLRRVCFWAYKQTLKSRLQLRFSSHQSEDYQARKTQLGHEADLYVQLLKYEHAYCKQIKHIDLDSYIDEKL